MKWLTSIELCAGGGGQALGLERAGFEHVALVENDKWACETLRSNRPAWNVLEHGIEDFDGTKYQGVDLLAGGLPCPPFSIAGKKLGEKDERNLFPEALRIIREVKPRAVLIENVRGLLDPKFSEFRDWFDSAISELGFNTYWALINAKDFGVPQLRSRVVFVALQPSHAGAFKIPSSDGSQSPMVGEVLADLMGAGGWEGAKAWSKGASAIAPTVVGGSKKHGGPDLGPTRAKRAWAEFGVCGMGIANEPPEPGFEGMPRLTTRMVARLQGFPDEWYFAGRKTNAYRQVGNAFPPPVAKAIGKTIATHIASCMQEVRVG